MLAIVVAEAGVVAADASILPVAVELGTAAEAGLLVAGASTLAADGHTPPGSTVRNALDTEEVKHTCIASCCACC